MERELKEIAGLLREMLNRSWVNSFDNSQELCILLERLFVCAATHRSQTQQFLSILMSILGIVQEIVMT